MNCKRHERAYVEQLKKEYEDICKAGFEGTIEQYEEYKESYTEASKLFAKLNSNIIRCPLCKSTNIKATSYKDDNEFIEEHFYVCQDDGIMFKDIRK